jgi:hypothetical protein
VLTCFGDIFVQQRLHAVRAEPVLMVLICGLVLALLAWGGVQIWGESIDKDKEPNVSTKTDPINAQPSGAGTFDNNPADGSSRPPEATDMSPTPSGSAAVRPR